MSLSSRANLVWACDDSNHLPSCQTLLVFVRTYYNMLLSENANFAVCFIYYTNKSTKNGACLDSSQLIVFQPSTICTCGSEAKCKPAFETCFNYFVLKKMTLTLTLTLKISTVTRSQIQNLFGSCAFLSLSCYTL